MEQVLTGGIKGCLGVSTTGDETGTFATLVTLATLAATLGAPATLATLAIVAGLGIDGVGCAGVVYSYAGW